MRLDIFYKDFAVSALCLVALSFFCWSGLLLDGVFEIVYRLILTNFVSLAFLIYFRGNQKIVTISLIHFGVQLFVLVVLEGFLHYYSVLEESRYDLDGNGLIMGDEVTFEYSNKFNVGGSASFLSFIYLIFLWVHSLTFFCCHLFSRKVAS